MKICIGIISYLPDSPESREVRKNKINNLINKCNEIFNLPILIIAQNWRGEVETPQNVFVNSYTDGLGIPKARQELRKMFLNTNYDYLIMFDDDCELVGTHIDGIHFLDQIKSHPDGWGYTRDWLLKPFAISRAVYSKIDVRDVDLTWGEASEDALLWLECRLHFPTKMFKFSGGLKDKSVFGWDPHSTWFHTWINNPNGQNITENTIKYFEPIERSYLPQLFPQHICLGVISYMPKNPAIREERINRINKLFGQLDNLFPGMETLIVAQCWESSDAVKIPSKGTVFHYNTGLGVVGARRELKRHFLEDTAYDHIILLEDDCDIQCDNPDDIYKYLREIYYHPRGYGEWHSHLVKLVAFSRFMYKQAEHYDVDYQNNGGYDDWVFLETLFNRFPKSKYQLPHNSIRECSNSFDDGARVWDTSKFNSNKCARSSAKMVKCLSRSSTKLIGISSCWTNEETKEQEKIQLHKTIKSLRCFNLPILIVAQQWTKADLDEFNYQDVIIYSFDEKFDYGEAHRMLQSIFLSDFEMDYLIFAHQDSEIVENSNRGMFFFLQELDVHKTGWGQVDVESLNLLCVSREIVNSLLYPNCFPNNRGLDDIVYHAALMLLYINKHFFISPRYLQDVGGATRRKMVQNWLKKDSNQELLIKNTHEFINNYFIPTEDDDDDSDCEDDIEYEYCYRYY